MKIIDFWDVAPYIIDKNDTRFEGAYCFHHQVDEFLSSSTSGSRFNSEIGSSIICISSSPSPIFRCITVKSFRYNTKSSFSQYFPVEEPILLRQNCFYAMLNMLNSCLIARILMP
jgi:hypothetical protein